MVVEQVAIDVVADFSASEVAAKLVLKNQAMLKDHAVLVTTWMIGSMFENIAPVIYAGMTTSVRRNVTWPWRPSSCGHVGLVR